MCVSECRRRVSPKREGEREMSHPFSRARARCTCMEALLLELTRRAERGGGVHAPRHTRRPETHWHLYGACLSLTRDSFVEEILKAERRRQFMEMRRRIRGVYATKFLGKI